MKKKEVLKKVQIVGSTMACGHLSFIMNKNQSLDISEKNRISIILEPKTNIPPEGMILIRENNESNGNIDYVTPGSAWTGDAIACFFWEDRSAAIARVSAENNAKWNWGKRLPEEAMLSFLSTTRRIPMRHKKEKNNNAHQMRHSR